MDIGETTIGLGVLSRAWFGASISDFVAADTSTVLGKLTANSAFSVDQSQASAWIWQIDFLKSQLAGLTGSVYFEFNIPRMGRRIDVVLLVGPAIFVIEFKVGESHFDRNAIDQVWDYALDLKNFHQASHEAPIVPILIATLATDYDRSELVVDGDKVFKPVQINPTGLRDLIDRALSRIAGTAINETWANSSYRPTPTIIEAARALYAQHSVDAIARSDAEARNLHATSQRVEELIDQARRQRQKIICFVTGVPGAGKTLVGLNIATHRRDEKSPTHAVFLSGNGPLVAVLREALARDEFARQKLRNPKARKNRILESVKAFIQNVHHFRDDVLADPNPPAERVVIFDEAQRAWNLEQTANFMRRKKNRPGFNQSEPEFLISSLDRHGEWAVIICLVGGGQEINTGEAGIGAWIEAISQSFPDWHTYISSKLIDSEYAAGLALDTLKERSNSHIDDCLHLSVSMRSFRAENVSAFVKALLDCNRQDAEHLFAQFSTRYPIVLSRDLDRAKQWIREHARGSERFGLLASSKAQRLKPHAIDIRVDIDPVHWFLDGKDDTRSSYFLEDAATEFQVQGLEIDWACVNWCADLRFAGSDWSYHSFRGDRWINVQDLDNRRYLLNAYRVLLTRARQGMVIFVPPGNTKDHTRPPAFYDATYSYLSSLGIPAIH